LTFAPDNTLYTVGFDFTNNNFGALRYDSVTGNPLPSPGNSGSIFVPTTDKLLCPLSITYTSRAIASVPESTLTVALLVFGGICLSQRRRKTQPR
jgi:hypothetical protein